MTIPPGAGSDYEPPIVRWVEEEDGSAGPVPAPDPNWSDLERLRYEAALIEERTGMRCRIFQINSADTYDFKIGPSSGGPAFTAGNAGTFLETRSFLTGIACTLVIVRR